MLPSILCIVLVLFLIGKVHRNRVYIRYNLRRRISYISMMGIFGSAWKVLSQLLFGPCFWLKFFGVGNQTSFFRLPGYRIQHKSFSSRCDPRRRSDSIFRKYALSIRFLFYCKPCIDACVLGAALPLSSFPNPLLQQPNFEIESIANTFFAHVLLKFHHL